MTAKGVFLRLIASLSFADVHSKHRRQRKFPGSWLCGRSGDTDGQVNVEAFRRVCATWATLKTRVSQWMFCVVIGNGRGDNVERLPELAC